MDISLASPFAWIAQGATLDVPLSARLLSNGVPVAGSMVNYRVVKGSGTLSSASPTTDVNGFADSTLHLAALAGDVQVSACAAPGNKPCQIFSVAAVAASALQLQPVGGSMQVLPVGQMFQPVSVRVRDSATPAHAVFGADVTFQVVVSRSAPVPPPISIGGIVINKNPSPIIVSSSQLSVLSDAAGLATLQPSVGGIGGAILVQGTSTAGASVLPFRLQSLSPVLPAAPPNAMPPPEGGSPKILNGARTAPSRNVPR